MRIFRQNQKEEEGKEIEKFGYGSHLPYFQEMKLMRMLLRDERDFELKFITVPLAIIFAINTVKYIT